MDGRSIYQTRTKKDFLVKSRETRRDEDVISLMGAAGPRPSIT
jgi:hypothetical protein